MTYTPVPGGTALVAGSQHDSLGGLTDDDHTQYALLAGRAGGQTLIGGTASGNNLTLQSTSNATKGEIRMGGATGLLWNEVSSRAAIGGAISSLWLVNLVQQVGVFGALRMIGPSTTTSARARLIDSADSRSMEFVQSGSGVVGTLAGVTAAGLGSITTENGSGFLLGSMNNAPLSLATNAVVRLAVSGAGVFTAWDGASFVFGSTTGVKLGAAGDKIGFYNATPVVQQARGATLTNNVTAGGTDDTIADIPGLALYVTDAPAIRNNIYQLARIVRQHDVALRALGLEN